MDEWDYSKLVFFDLISKVLRILYIMPHDLEIFWDIIEMRSFQLKVLINYHTKEFGFIYSFHKDV